MLRRFALIIGVLLISLDCRAAPDAYDYNANCARAYNLFLSLKLAEGRTLINTELRQNPGNLMAVYLSDYEDCILLLINCDKNDYTRVKDGMESRLRLLAAGNRSSPWYRFCFAGMHLHRAIVSIRFGEQYKAALHFRKSFALLKENKRQFPDFEYNNVIAGLQEAVVGTLPGSYKWLAAVFGIRGSVQKGTDKLATFVNTHKPSDPLYTETLLYYMYARFYLLAEQEQVWQFLSGSNFPTTDNLLNTFVKANIALDYRKADDAIALLDKASEYNDYGKYPIFQYQRGMAFLTRCDSGATYYFNQYLRNNKSDLLIKDTWQKMAFAWHVNDQPQKAALCRSRIRNSGTARIDPDKQANRFADADSWPDKNLLKARLFIEGGYYTKALEILRSISTDQLTSPADKAEYFFRLGHVYQELAANPHSNFHYNDAIEQFRTAMKEGAGRHEQFAARAALHIGKIFEKLKMDTEAIDMYNECLNMPAHDFQNSIDQQAKSGINRIEWRNAEAGK